MKLETMIRRFRVQAVIVLLPVVALVSLSDAAVLGGLRIFLAIFDEGGRRLLPVWLLEGWSMPESHALGLWCLLMLALVGFRLVALLLKHFRVERFTRWLEVFLRVRHRKLVKRLPADFHHSPESAEKLQVSQESGRVMVLAAEASAQAMQAILQLAVFLPLLFWISWELTLAMLLGMLPLMVWIQRTLRHLAGRMKARVEALGHYEVSLSIWAGLVRQWTLSRDLKQVEGGLIAETRNLWSESYRLGVRKGILVQVGDSVAALAVIGVLAVCGNWLIAGSMRASDLVLFSAALLLAYKPVKDCLRVVPLLREGVSAYHQLNSMEKLPRITKSSRAILRNADAECVVIRDLSFAYQSEPVQPVFKGFSGIFPMYKPVWLRGPNGCGKTTLLRILAGLEQVTDGTIHWHPSVSGDHAFLSHRGETPPVWVFGDEWKEIMKGNGARQLLLETLGVPGFIGRDALSAGQRQRLGIAWVFCSGAKVLLLDEPFSFIAQADREPILQAMLACAKEQKQWFVMASHDGISAESAEYFHFVDVAGIPILK